MMQDVGEERMSQILGLTTEGIVDADDILK